jgi:hypothetical protein
MVPGIKRRIIEVIVHGPLIPHGPRTKRTMKNATYRLLIALTVTVMAAFPNNAPAQTPPTHDGALVVKIKGLTAATRDAIARDIAPQGDLRLSYACVPAGILVLEPTGRTAQPAMRNLSMPVIERHARSRDITELSINKAQAEEQCAQARNR